MQKILVTGGCGYIGSHTIVDLIENGQDSYCTTIIRQEGYNQTSYGTSIVF